MFDWFSEELKILFIKILAYCISLGPRKSAQRNRKI